MELSAQLAQAGRRLTLRWYPRLQNTEADDLSNGRVQAFNPALRVFPDYRPEALIVLPDLIRYGEELYSALEARRESRPSTDTPAPKRKKGDRLRDRDPW